MDIKPIQKENETQNLQEQCDVGSTIRSRMLETKMMDKGSIHFTIDVCVEFYLYSGQEQFQIKNCMKR